MQYFSSSFNTLHKVKNFFKYSIREISLFTDYLFFICTTNLDDDEFSLVPPQNIYYSKLEDDNMNIFWGSEKAISEINIIATFKSSVDSLEEANDISKNIMGFSFDYCLKVNFKDVDRHLEKLNRIKTSTSLQEVINTYREISISDNYFKEFVSKTSEDIGKQIKMRRGTMEFNPKFKAKNIVIKENQAFYVLPFQDQTMNAYKAIKDAVDKENIDCMIIKSEDRFDPNRGNNIVENIWQDICSSRFIIADLSQKNPNVYYELGICDAIGKTVIPICSKESLKNDYNNSLPFDISGGYTIFYDEDYTGMEKLKSDIVIRIKAILDGIAVDVI